jgi:hypothetical protein
MRGSATPDAAHGPPAPGRSIVERPLIWLPTMPSATDKSYCATPSFVSPVPEKYTRSGGRSGLLTRTRPVAPGPETTSFTDGVLLAAARPGLYSPNVATVSRRARIHRSASQSHQLGRHDPHLERLCHP